MYNWLNYLISVIINYFSNQGQMIDSQKLLQNHFDNQLWINIRNFIRNLKSLQLWKDRSMASTVFAGKNNYDYWKVIFQNGKSPDGVQVLIKPLNFVEMIKPLQV